MSFFCIGNEPKSGLARDLGDCLQSRNVPFGTSGDSDGQESARSAQKDRTGGYDYEDTVYLSWMR